MVRHEGIALVLGREHGARVEREPERRRVCLERERGRLHPRAVGAHILGVRLAGEVALRPAIPSAVPQDVEVLGWHIVAQVVAVVVVGPQLARGRVEREPDGIAESGGERVWIRAVEVVAGYGRPRQRVVAHVARGADGDIEQVIRPERDRSRDVAATREVRDERHRCRRTRIEPLHRRLLGEVHRVAAEGEAERVGQAAQDGAPRVSNAVAVRIHQPDDLANIRECDEDRAAGTEGESARAV